MLRSRYLEWKGTVVFEKAPFLVKEKVRSRDCLESSDDFLCDLGLR